MRKKKWGLLMTIMTLSMMFNIMLTFGDSSGPVMIGSTYYPTLNAALAGAVNGDTIVLLQDVTEIVVYTVLPNKNLRIDGRGHTIYGGVNPDFSYALRLSGEGTLILKDITLKGQNLEMTKPQYMETIGLSVLGQVNVLSEGTVIAQGGNGPTSIGLAYNGTGGTVDITRAIGGEATYSSCGVRMSTVGTVNVNSAQGGKCINRDSYGILNILNGIVNANYVKAGDAANSYILSNWEDGSINVKTAERSNMVSGKIYSYHANTVNIKNVDTSGWISFMGVVNHGVDTKTISLIHDSEANCVLDEITVAAIGKTNIGNLPSVVKNGSYINTWYKDWNLEQQIIGVVDGTVSNLYTALIMKPVVNSRSGESFSTVNAALSAAQNGDTIKLYSDLNESVIYTVAEDKVITLDGQNHRIVGKSITVTSTPLTLYGTGAIKLKNLDLRGVDLGNVVGSNSYGLYVDGHVGVISEGTVTVTGGTAENSYGLWSSSTEVVHITSATGQTASNDSYGMCNSGQGTVNASLTIGGLAGHWSLGAYNQQVGTVNIKAAVGLTAPNSFGVLNNGNGTANIETATGGTATQNSHGVCNLASGTVNVKSAISGQASDKQFAVYNPSGYVNVFAVTGEISNEYAGVVNTENNIQTLYLKKGDTTTCILKSIPVAKESSTQIGHLPNYIKENSSNDNWYLDTSKLTPVTDTITAGITEIYSNDYTPYSISRTNVKYVTLNEALVAAIDGDTVNLLGNVQESAIYTVLEDKSLTIDGHNFKITGIPVGMSPTALSLSGTGNIKLKNLELQGADVEPASGNPSYGLYVEGDVNVNSEGTVSAIGGTAQKSFGLWNQSTGMVNISSAIGGTATESSHGVANIATGIVNVTDAIGGQSSQDSYGIYNGGQGSINARVAIGGGNHETLRSIGAYNQGTGTINAKNIIGGDSSVSYGAFNNGNGVINAEIATGGTATNNNSYGVNNVSSGTVNVIKAVGGTSNYFSYAIYNSNGMVNASDTVGSLNYGSGLLNTGEDIQILSLKLGETESCILETLPVAKVGDTRIGKLPSTLKEGIYSNQWHIDATKLTAVSETVVSGTSEVYSKSYAPYSNDRTGIKYETLVSALAAAANGDVINLLGNVQESVIYNLISSKNLTIDGHNHKITGISTSVSPTALSIGGTGTIKLKALDLQGADLGSMAGKSSYGLYIYGNANVQSEDRVSATGGTAESSFGLWNESTGIVNITSATGGTATHNSHGLCNLSTGTVNIEKVTGGEAGVDSYGIYNVGEGKINASTVTAGIALNNSIGAYNGAAGTLNVKEVIGEKALNSYGAWNKGIGSVNIETALGGSATQNSHGVYNSNTGTVNVKKATGGVTTSGTCYDVYNLAGTVNVTTVSDLSKVEQGTGAVNTGDLVDILNLKKDDGTTCVLDTITVAASGGTQVGQLPTVFKEGVYNNQWHLNLPNGAVISGQSVYGGGNLYSDYYSNTGYTISGKITGNDALSGINAQIQLKDKWQKNVGALVTTASDGSYTLSGIQPDTQYKLEVSCVGYVNQAIASVDVADVNLSNLNLQLQRSVLQGTVTLDNTTPKYGDALNSLVSDSNNTGILTYQWLRNGSLITGATSSSYTVTEQDINKELSIKVNSSIEAGEITSALTSAVEKRDSISPGVPTVLSRTFNTLTLNEVIGCEYAINNGDYQSSAIFTGLMPDTSYTFTQRIKETTTQKPSLASGIFAVSTTPANALSGTLMLNISTPKYGEHLTAILTNSNNTGNLSYQWLRDDVEIVGVTGASYWITEADIHHSISVKVTCSVETDALVSDATALVSKLENSVPVAPSMQSKSFDSITLKAVTGYEYAINGSAYQDQVIFEGLSSETSYQFTQRIKETSTLLPSIQSGGITIVTDKVPVYDLTGIVSIDNQMPKFGDTLTASIADSNNTGTLSYQWLRDGTEIIGAITITYVISEADIDKEIAVRITSDTELGARTSAATSTVSKAEQAAPPAPSMQSKSYDTIILESITGCEYAINYGDYQSSAVFTGLMPNTSYTFTQRVMATATHVASTSSGAISIVTEQAPINALTGIVSIDNQMPKFGDTLTASIADSNNTGTLSYQWLRDGTEIIGATNVTYVISEADIDKEIAVRITSDTELGARTSAATSTVSKAEQAAPPAPSMQSKSYDTIILESITGCEYAINYGDYQSSAVFIGLMPNTSYTFTQRVMATATHVASTSSGAISIVTEQAPINALTGIVSIDNQMPKFGDTLTASIADSNNTGTLSYQWLRDGTEIIGATNVTYVIEEVDIDKEIAVRITSDTEPGARTSAATSTVSKAEQAAPPAPSMQSKSYDTIILGSVAGCEYAINNGDYQSSTVFTGLMPNTSYTFTQRVMATATHVASTSSGAISIVTEQAPINALTGIVSIDNQTPKFGDTLTASIADSNNTGTLSYQWLRDGTEIIGATNVTYVISEADIDKEIAVRITSDTELGSRTSAATSTVSKAEQVAPPAPSMQSKSYDTIILESVAGCEYAINNGDYQSSVVFTGLMPNTSYTFTQRYSETLIRKASLPSDAISIVSKANSIEGDNSTNEGTTDKEKEIQNASPIGTVIEGVKVLFSPNVTMDIEGKVTAEITEAQLIALIDRAGEAAVSHLEIHIETPISVKAVKVKFDKTTFNDALKGKIKKMTVSTPVATLNFNKNSLLAMESEMMGDVEITIAQEEPETLDEKKRDLIKERPLFDFTVTNGGVALSNLKGTATVFVPYTPQNGEDPDALVIYHLSEEGQLVIGSHSEYLSKLGGLKFETKHFSKYIVGYNKVIFKDMPRDSESSKAITYIAARGITSGTGNGMYSPKATLTRGQFIVLVMKAFGIEPDILSTDNFEDAGKSYYTKYLSKAKKMGLVDGLGNNLYAPEASITKQEMACMLYKTLKQLETLPENIEGMNSGLTVYTDVKDMAPWAEESMTYFIESGIIKNIGNQLNPTEEVTREQMAKMLYNILIK